MSLLPKILIALGFLLILFGTYLVIERYNPKKLEFKDLKISKSISSEIIPIRVIIPTLGIDNGIFRAEIHDGNWEATTKGVSHLSSTPVPGGAGNSVLYGHNFPSILGNLANIKPEDVIEIVMSNGEKRKFIVKFTAVVDPTQTHILSQTMDTRITIYTCTGFLDSKRFVATAILAN